MPVDRLTLLESLSCAFGVAGAEGQVMEILDGLLRRRFHGTRDRFGNRMYRSRERSDAGVRIVLAAHADEVGFVVQAVRPEGFLSFLPLGSWCPLAAVGLPIRIKGSLGFVDGVIGIAPPHHKKENPGSHAPDWMDLWMDIGSRSARETCDMFGVRPGDPATPASIFKVLRGGHVLMGKAWDDRVGCALLVEALEELDTDPAGAPNAVWAVATVQEEVGGRGAAVVAERVKADVAVILEGAPADDFPGRSDWESQARMGKGVQIRSYDPSMIANPGLRDFLIEIAEQEGIPWQVAVRRTGGTDGGPLHKSCEGVPTIVVAVPVRYAHSGAGLIDLSDYEACLRLVVSACRRLSRDVVDCFSS
mgnify:CR=1 FL=1